MIPNKKQITVLFSTFLLGSGSLLAQNSSSDSLKTPDAPRRVAITATPLWSSLYSTASVEVFGKSYQKNKFFTEKSLMFSARYAHGHNLDNLMQNKKGAASYGIDITRKHFINAAPSRVFRPYVAYGLGVDYTKLNGTREKESDGSLSLGTNPPPTEYYHVNQEMLRQQVFGHIGTEVVFRNGFMFDTYIGLAYQNVCYFNNVPNDQRINSSSRDVGFNGIRPTLNWKLGYMIGEKARPKTDFTFGQDDQTETTNKRKIVVSISPFHLLTGQLRTDVEIFSKTVRPDAVVKRQSLSISPRFYSDYKWFIGDIDNKNTYGYGLDLAHKLYVGKQENAKMYIGYGAGLNYLNLEGKLTEFFGNSPYVNKQLLRFQGYTMAGVQLVAGRNIVLDSYVGIGYKGTHQLSASNNTELDCGNFTSPVYNGFYPVFGLKAGIQFGQ